MTEKREEIPITIFVRDGGHPVAPPPPALPSGDSVTGREFIAALRAKWAYEDAVSDAFNESFDRHFRKAVKA